MLWQLKECIANKHSSHGWDGLPLSLSPWPRASLRAGMVPAFPGNAVLLEQRPLLHVGEKLSPIQPGKQ